MRKLVLPVVCLCALLLPYYGGETRDVAYRSGGGGGFRKRGGGGGGTGVSSLSRAAEEGGNGDVEAAKAWLLEYDVEAEKVYYAFVSASWKYNTDITPENAAEEIAQSLIAAEFDNEMAISANEFDWKNFDDEKVKREFSKITDIGYAALEPEKVEEINTLLSDMSTIYNTGRVCKFGLTCEENDNTFRLPLDPDIKRILSTSRNYYELLHYWTGWRDNVGTPMRQKYIRFTELSNEASTINGYEDTGDYWKSRYESDTFEKDVADLMEQMMPLYEKLHTYTRHKLGLWYGLDKVPQDGPIPAHLLGYMHAETWEHIYDILEPFPGAQTVDVTDAMVEQGYDATEIFRVSEEFFTSLGLIAMPDVFWNESMIVKPEGREVNCHASAWDFYNKKDFRIKQCTDINMQWLTTTHHEMGHVEYFLQYKDQPTAFRDGANPGFHEAIGDLMALSVETPNHLQKIGLLDSVVENKEADVNFLMKMALGKIAFIPFGYLIDQWRWSLFSGEYSTAEMNEKWWDLRCKWQGLKSDSVRTEENFDPGSKYHIPSNTPYIRYFVSYIIQFQFHKSLCETAGHTGSLHTCDIYKNIEAGDKLAEAMKLGASKPWQDAMEILTGQTKMDATAIMEYFQPLIDWLDEQISEHELTQGWDCTIPSNGGASRAHAASAIVVLLATMYSLLLLRLS